MVQMRDKHEQNLNKIENASVAKQGQPAAKRNKPGSLVEASEQARKAFNRTRVTPQLEDVRTTQAV